MQARNLIVVQMNNDPLANMTPSPLGIISRSNSVRSVSSQVIREREDIVKQLIIMGVNMDVA